MAHTHTLLLYHIVFSTKGRRRCLTSEARALLFPYISGIIEKHGGFLIIGNGVEDHVHLLCRLRPRPELAWVVQNIKGGSSSWFNKECGMGALHWQEGYGAFTVSQSQLDRVFLYIQNQESHHRNNSFEKEYEALLLRHGVEYGRRFFLD